MRHSFHFLHGYAAVGVALVGNMMKDAYTRTHDVCEMFPQFEFLPTFQDEILLHHTRLPLLNVPVSTIAVVAALLAGFVATYLRLIEMLWLFLIDFFSGRWLYNLFYIHIPAWLPFLVSEPGVPDLISDPEDVDALDNDRSMNATASMIAMAKLVEVKLQHANHTITRPDDWLVFDPEEEQLVTKKDLDARRLRRNQSASSSSSNSTTSTSTSTSPSSRSSSPTKHHTKHLPTTESDNDDPTADHDDLDGPVRRKR